MNKNKHINHWVDSAERDLDVAKSLFKPLKFDWSLFVGHLVLEKVLKALYIQKLDKSAPKIHNLLRLAEFINLELDEKQKIFLNEVSDFQIESRYPDYQQSFY